LGVRPLSWFFGVLKMAVFGVESTLEHSRPKSWRKTFFSQHPNTWGVCFGLAAFGVEIHSAILSTSKIKKN